MIVIVVYAKCYHCQHLNPLISGPSVEITTMLSMDVLKCKKCGHYCTMLSIEKREQ